MNILCLGDIVGRSGRDVISKYLPELRSKLKIDYIIANVDNIAHGIGVTKETLNWCYDNAIDVLTGGNHLWDKREIIPYISSNNRLLRALNYPLNIPGKGIFSEQKGNIGNIVVIHLMGQLFMPQQLNDPFSTISCELEKWKLGVNANAIIIDFHAEATSEKNALAYYLDGKVSLVFGTHTHIPTSDYRVLNNGTAFVTDIGMCGDYNSIIGMKPENVIDRFTKKYNSVHLENSIGEGTLCGIFVKINDKTGLAEDIKQIILGTYLEQRS